MQLNRIELQWSGPQVIGGGVSVLHTAGDVGGPNVADILSALTTAKNIFPTGVVITVPGTGDVIEDTTGVLVDTWTASGGGTVTCNGDALCAGGVGASISWLTGGIVNGRRLRGRTFLVPLTAIAYSASGQLDATYRGWIQTLANAIQASNPLAVWHRPTTKGGSDGNSYGVVSNRVNPKVAMLRSRRD